MQPNHESAFLSIIANDPWLMEHLRAGQSLGLAHWAIAAGTIRTAVWDHLHGYTHKTPSADIDFVFFDAMNTAYEYEKEIEKKLALRKPDANWEAVNQATVHTYSKDQPYASLEHAMSRWAETPTAVGVYLQNEDLRYFAPHGLDDLMEMIVRPHLVTVDAPAVYADRIANKRWDVLWPRVTLLGLDGAVVRDEKR